MSYCACLPQPALRRLVKCYWHLDDPAAEGGNHTVLPDGCMEIIVHFGALPRMTSDGRVPVSAQRAFVGGQISRAIGLEPTGRIGMVGVRLWPWGGGPLLGIAMQEIASESVNLADIAGHGAADLPGRLAAATDAEQRFRIVDRFMLVLGRRAAGVNPLAAAAIRQLDRTHGSVSVAGLVAELGVSERHLNRILQHNVGLSAKSYARIRRFQSCIGAIRRGDVTSLADAAHHAGYTDQAHLSHDLKKLCGLTPRALLQEQRLLVEPGG
ncbi:MAG: helix-turn-helix domain-containing protein [Pseudomonadales bacterium]